MTQRAEIDRLARAGFRVIETTCDLTGQPTGHFRIWKDGKGLGDASSGHLIDALSGLIKREEEPALTPEDAWQDLLDKDDRTSPEDYPEMALITFDELRDYMEGYKL